MNKWSHEDLSKSVDGLIKSNVGYWLELKFEFDEKERLLTLLVEVAPNQDSMGNLSKIFSLISEHLRNIMPVYQDEFSWLAVVVCEGRVIDAVFGGKASPQVRVSTIIGVLEGKNNSKWDLLYWEIQEKGRFLYFQFHINEDQWNTENLSSIVEIMRETLDPIMPTYEDQYSWMGVVTCGGQIVDSIFGGGKSGSWSAMSE